MKRWLRRTMIASPVFVSEIGHLTEWLRSWALPIENPTEVLIDVPEIHAIIHGFALLLIILWICSRRRPRR